MNRRGFLLAEEVVKIIIAVIALGLLSYLLFSLYNLNKTSNELELAESSLEHLVQELSAERNEVEIFNPKGWWIVSEENLGENVLCICKDPGECDAAGVCLENVNDFLIKGAIVDFTDTSILNPKVELRKAIEIDNPPIVLKINYGDKSISKV